MTAPSIMHDALLLLQQVWDTPSIAMKLPFATPSPSRRPSEAGSHVGGSDSEAPEHPWGLVLSQFATVARHDPRREVCCVYILSTRHVAMASALPLLHSLNSCCILCLLCST